jgi:hypothetical protein
LSLHVFKRLGAPNLFSYWRALVRVIGSLDTFDLFDSVGPEPPKKLLDYVLLSIPTAAGITPRRFLNLALTSMVEIALLETRLIVASKLPAVIRKTADRALTDKGVRDRKLFFEWSAFLFEAQRSKRDAAPQPTSEEWPHPAPHARFEGEKPAGSSETPVTVAESPVRCF